MEKKEFRQVIKNAKKLVNENKLHEAYCELWNELTNEFDGIDEVLQDFITVDLLEDFIVNRVNGFSDLQDIYYRLRGIDYINEELFIFNGYGNVNNVKKDDLELAIFEIEQIVKEQL